MITTQQSLNIAEAIGHVILTAHDKLEYGQDVTQILDIITGLAELDEFHPISYAMKKFKDNEVFVKYYSSMEDTESKELLYYASCVLRMLLSELFGKGYSFKTVTGYDVRVTRNDMVFAISFHCPNVHHTVALDIWELDLVPVLKELKDRVDYINEGSDPEHYPVKVKTNHYQSLKEPK